MRYGDYRYLWPPRPEKAVPPALIGFYERRGWAAQVKKNGTCTEIFSCGANVIFKTRHNDDHKAWEPLPQHVAFFAGREKWNVYVAELLHSKGPRLKNHLYLFDILVSDGMELIGETFTARQEILRQRFPSPKVDISGSRAGVGARLITDHISHADLVESPSKLWETLGDLDEGLVFKDPKSKLLPCTAERSNGAWQVKVRRPHSNYSF
jgi:hypothetical protein